MKWVCVCVCVCISLICCSSVNLRARAKQSNTLVFTANFTHMFITDDDDEIQHFNWNESSILHENTNQPASQPVKQSAYIALLFTFIVFLFFVFCLVIQHWKWWCDGNGSERGTLLSSAAVVAAAAACHWVCAFFDWLMVFGWRKTCYYKTL